MNPENAFEFKFNAYYILEVQWPINENWRFASVLPHIISTPLFTKCHKQDFFFTLQKNKWLEIAQRRLHMTDFMLYNF